MTESTFKLLVISQFLYEVMLISLLPENSTLYMVMDFCISLGMGWSSILCYVWSLFYMIRIYIMKVIHTFYFYLLPNGSTV